jgi:hypothetical protein
MKNLGGKKNACISAYQICGVKIRREPKEFTEDTIKNDDVDSSAYLQPLHTA